MARVLVWTKDKTRAAWGCSECAWEFEPSDDLIAGHSQMYTMVVAVNQERDKQFSAHVCAQHPRK
jgi:hypothetical protein